MKEFRMILVNIYSGSIFPSLNHANRTTFIGQWIESTWSVQFNRAKPERRHCDVIRLRQNVTKKFRRIDIFIFIEMWSLLDYSRENFKSFFFSLGLLEKGFQLEDIVNIRNECLIFLHSWEMNLDEAVTNLPRTASRFTGFVTCLTKVHFQWTQKKRHSFLKWHQLNFE